MVLYYLLPTAVEELLVVAECNSNSNSNGKLVNNYTNLIMKLERFVWTGTRTGSGTGKPVEMRLKMENEDY